MAYKIASAPTSEPFTTAYVKTWLKIPASVTVEDTLLADIIVSARQWAEHGSGRALFTQTVEEYWDCFPACGALKLSLAPVQSVTSVSYISGGSYAVWASSNYTVDTVSEPCRIVAKQNASFLSHDIGVPNAVKAVYVAGSATTATIPGTIKDAMLQRIAFLYENREDIPISNNNQPRLRSADALLQKSRVFW